MARWKRDGTMERDDAMETRWLDEHDGAMKRKRDGAMTRSNAMAR
jgi:hypothetical protein